jgi:hypothetical protein
MIDTAISRYRITSIYKALEKDRNLRYQHASDMRTDLQRLKRDRESGRYPAKNPVQAANGGPVEWGTRPHTSQSQGNGGRPSTSGSGHSGSAEFECGGGGKFSFSNPHSHALSLLQPTSEMHA